MTRVRRTLVRMASAMGVVEVLAILRKTDGTLFGSNNRFIGYLRHATTVSVDSELLDAKKKLLGIAVIHERPRRRTKVVREG